MRETVQQPWSPRQFLERSQAFDLAVMQTDGIDQFCSSSAWILPAHQAFLPEHTLWIQEYEHGFAALARGEDPNLGVYLHPLEASWALASPLIGRNAASLTRAFVETCRHHDTSWNLLFLSGISPQSVQFRELVRGFRRDFSMGLGTSSMRRVADLQYGVDGFLANRASKFRSNLRRARRRAEKSGILYEYLPESATTQQALAWFERALRIEALSWKGKTDTGIIDGPMKVFYQVMLPMLAERKSLRFVFVTLDGQDIAYCFGANFNGQFRGLQMSYDDAYSEHSPGSLAQFEMIIRLCEEKIQSYDLGSDMDYKQHWAEEGLETVALVVRR